MTFLCKCWCYGAILITISTSTLAYNFDVNNVIMYEDVAESVGSRESYFGFTVALWNSSHTEIDNSWIFIGAPRANSSEYPLSIEPGTVFKCKIGRKCEEWVMETTYGKGPGNGSWLGGSMKMQYGSKPLAVVCGPRWLDKRLQGVRSRTWPMKGICYQGGAESNKKGIPFLPPYDENFGSWESYVMAESGFSIDIVPNSNRGITLGCPGLSLARGTPIQYDVSTAKFLIPYPSSSNTAGQDDYSGYAVTSGYYFGRQYGRVYATSAPRSAFLYGKVILFRFGTPQIDAWKIIDRKQQVGEYFGSTLASCDINGDQKDDLIVGAPQWTNIVDEGRIYIFRGINNIQENFGEPQTFEGETPRGRFGTAVTCLGDIDYDGYADVAVGAPYEVNGVVYIYHGSKGGLKLTQKLLGPEPTKGFGISISEPRDIDNNGYADIAVGAYLSGHVILFRSKRAVTTKVTLSTDLLEGSLQPNATSFLVHVCSSYSGEHAPQTLSVSKELKVDEVNQRAEIHLDGNQRTYKFSDVLQLHKESCRNMTIKIKNGTNNFLDPLTLSVIQRLDTSNENGTLLVAKNGTVFGAQHFDSNSAVINDIYEQARAYQNIPFESKCGEKICNSHLSIQLATNLKNGNSFVIGSESYIELKITVHNSGDLAYFTRAEIIIPPLVQLSHIPLTCTPEPLNKKIKVTCDISNPLGTNEMKNVSLSLDVTSLVATGTTRLNLNARATTQSNDTAMGRNANLLINFVEETDIGITRKVTMDQYSYNLVGKEEKLPSIAFQHIYEVKNYEVTPISQAVLSVSIPTHWIHAGKEIEIVRLNKTNGFLDREEFKCTDSEIDKNISSISYDATTQTEWLNGSSESIRLGLKPDEKFTVIQGRVSAASADNRTLHINCTNPLVKWKTINCQLTSFKSPEYVARLALIFDLLLSNFTPEIIGDKDIIFFVTNGSVKILEPSIETIHKEPNLIMIGTMFVGSPPESRVSAWIIVVSLLVGLLLLMLVILGLWKFGFFKRTKQVELRALLEGKDEGMPAETAPAESMSNREASADT